MNERTNEAIQAHEERRAAARDASERHRFPNLTHMLTVEVAVRLDGEDDGGEAVRDAIRIALSASHAAFNGRVVGTPEVTLREVKADPCVKCGAAASHSYSGPDGGGFVRLCCACYVAVGGAPADWHPACMAAASVAGGH